MSPSGSGMSRAELAAFADRLLLSLRPHATPGRAGFLLPGGRSGLGSAIDGLEAFTRSLLAAGFRLAGEQGADPLGLADWYATGITAGTDPTAADRWPTLTEHPQAKVEAASLALVLDLTRPWLWDRMDSATQERVVAYLAPAVGDPSYHRNNWVWFRLVTQTFLRSVGGPFRLDEMESDLATHDSFVRPDGWLSDGDARAYDHYAGWALQLYPTLWARMSGAADLAAPRAQGDTALLDRYLTDAVALIGADGSLLLQGRSLIYRFAAAAPFWAGALREVPSLPAGQLRRAATKIVSHFINHDVASDTGLLSMGWFHEWIRLAQFYSGPGSPYWAMKGLLGLALPDDHPVWTAPEVLLPAESKDQLFAIQSPGWLVSSSVTDGAVRVINHGTDHAHPGDIVCDSPLYARLGYSTATTPLLDVASWVAPLDNSVAVLDAAGRASHRAGWQHAEVRIDHTEAGPLGVGTSSGHLHWIDTDAEGFNVGYGLTGEATPAGELQIISLVRGSHEIRLARLSHLPISAEALRIGGWPHVGTLGAATVTPLTPALSTGSDLRHDASPLGGESTTHFALFPATDSDWSAVLVTWPKAPASATSAAIAITTAPTTIRVCATWPDGATSTTTIALQTD